MGTCTKVLTLYQSPIFQDAYTGSCRYHVLGTCAMLDALIRRCMIILTRHYHASSTPPRSCLLCVCLFVCSFVCKSFPTYVTYLNHLSTHPNSTGTRWFYKELRLFFSALPRALLGTFLPTPQPQFPNGYTSFSHYDRASISLLSHHPV